MNKKFDPVLDKPMPYEPRDRTEPSGKLIWPRITYGGDGKPHDNSEYIDKYKGKNTIVFDVGAPGYGRVIYRITNIDDKGIWGVLLKDESGELTPDMVRENKNMNEATKFRNMVKECISEIKKERDPRIRLKESLRKVVKNVLQEMATVPKPEPDKDEKETISKGYNKKGNERSDKTNDKLLDELETIVHGIDPSWEAYWDDHGQLIARAQNLLYVRIAPKFENNFDVDAMVRLVDRVRAIALTWEQVKSFIKANFGDLKSHKKTKADDLRDKALDQTNDKEVIKKDAGPESQKVKVRYQDPKTPSVKDTKRDDRNYNEPQTKRDEDMPDQPMKRVTEPGKDPESKNKDIKKTEKVKPPKHKLDKKLRIPDKKTSKFTLKQVS